MAIVGVDDRNVEEAVISPLAREDIETYPWGMRTPTIVLVALLLPAAAWARPIRQRPIPRAQLQPSRKRRRKRSGTRS